MSKIDFSKPENCEKYSFLWSEARLVVAAVALLAGGVPPLFLILPIPALYGLESMILRLAWLISGAAAGYLLYRWNKHKTLFGKKEQKDLIAFIVSTVSGIHLGFTGLTGTNIGLGITKNYLILLIVAALYLWSAWHLWQRWNKTGKKML